MLKRGEMGHIDEQGRKTRMIRNPLAAGSETIRKKEAKTKKKQTAAAALGTG